MTSSTSILLVDDDAAFRHVMAGELRRLGHTIRAAGSGEEALRSMVEAEPRVVLLDIGMPGMNGYEVARRLREPDGLPDALLIAVTGWGQAADRRQSREAGFDHHLTKPADPAELDGIAPAGVAPQEPFAGGPAPDDPYAAYRSEETRRDDPYAAFRETTPRREDPYDR